VAGETAERQFGLMQRNNAIGLKAYGGVVGQLDQNPMERHPIDMDRVREVARKLVALYATEALPRARELENSSSVKAFAEAVTIEVKRILGLS